MEAVLQYINVQTVVAFALGALFVRALWVAEKNRR